MSFRSAVPALVIVTALAIAPPAGAGPWSLAPGEYASSFVGGGYTAWWFHDVNGGRPPLPAGGTLEQRSLDSSIEMGWTKRMNFVLGIPFESVSRREGNQVRTETGLSDATLGVRWKLMNGATALAFEADWKAPLGYNRHVFATHADSVAAKADAGGDSVNDLRLRAAPRLGDGQQDITFALLAGRELPGLHAFVEVEGGYRKRFDDPADQAVVNADAGYWVLPTLLVSGHYLGAIAIGDGRTPADKITTHLVGPEVRYRVDEHLDMIAGSLHTASAKNALHVDRLYAGITYKQTRLNRLQGFFGGTKSP